MQVTLLRTGLDAHEALMIGDTAYDIEAARTAQVRVHRLLLWCLERCRPCGRACHL